MESIWSESSKSFRFEKQSNDIKTDILIIGGGMPGILCAYFLEKAGADYVLAEADRICGGITKNTTAKITFQHGLIYDRLINSFGEEYAKLYLDANAKALNKYRQLCKNIDCDFEEKDAYVYSLNDQQSLRSEVRAYKTLGADAEFVAKTSLPLETAGAVRVKNQAQFHPLKFAYSIAKGLRIFENTKVLEFKPNYVTTNHGKIKANKIIVATHFPIINKHGSYFIKLYQHRSYVIALENALNVNGMYVDEAKTGLSFRNYKNLLLLGGGSHRTGKSGGNWNELREYAKKWFPNAKEIAYWATQDCMSLDGIPYIGRYSKRTPNLYVATGFSKWGMSSSMVSAMILSDMVLGKENRFEEIFSPSRSILYPQLAINAAESLIALLTPSVPRCPHLKCALKYNKAEHSWDCPCHGSRFDKSGELIDNPATDDL